MRPELLRLEDLCLNRPGRPALDHLHLNLFRGEILCVAGLYGSGRRTLAQALSGEIPVDSGRIFLDEARMHYEPHRLRFPGVCHITERSSLLPQLSVAENLCIPHTCRWVRWKQVTAEAAKVLRQFSLPFFPDQPVSALSFPDRLRLELVRACRSRASLIVIDPFWGRFSQDELAGLQAFLKRLQGENLSFLLFSHPEQIPAPAERVVLLRHGQAIRSLTPAEAAAAPLSSWLRDEPLPRPNGPRPAAGRCVLETRLPGVSLRLHAGEIAGVWYRHPSPAEAVLGALLGDRPAARGQLLLDGKSYRARSRGQANRQGVLRLDERSPSRALFDNLSLADNLSVTPHRNSSLFLSPRVRRFLTREACRELGVPDLPSPRMPLEHLGLSVEQLQMLYLARFARQPARLLVCRNPFALMDPVFRERFLQILCQKAAEGTAVLIFSNNLNNLQFCSTLYRFDEQDRLCPYAARRYADQAREPAQTDHDC